MPCYTVTSSTVQWSAATDQALLLRAIEALGLVAHTRADGTIAANSLDGYGSITYDTTTHKMILRGATPSEDQIKRAYSTEVVDYVAKKMAWRKSNHATKENTFVVQRRK
jgi:hypothetical protein